MRSEPRATPVARGMGLDEQRNRQTNRKTIEHMQSTDTQIFKTTGEVRAGEHDRCPRAKGEHGKDAGRVSSSATHPTEDAARRRLAAASAGGGAPERTSAVADGTSSIDFGAGAGTCTGEHTGNGSCSVTMSEAHALTATLE